VDSAGTKVVAGSARVPGARHELIKPDELAATSQNLAHPHFGLGIFGFIVTLGSDDSIAGPIISGAMTVALFYFGLRRLRLLRGVH